LSACKNAIESHPISQENAVTSGPRPGRLVPERDIGEIWSDFRCGDYPPSTGGSRFGCGGKSLEFRVQSSEFRVQSSEFRVQSSEFRVQSSEFRVQSSEFRVQGSGFRVHIEFRV
jgi:hypothetical protein